MNIHTTYRKYKIDKLLQQGKYSENVYLLVDVNYEGFFIGEIKVDAEPNPLNMDRIYTFYPIRKSDVEIFHNELKDIKQITASLLELQLNLQLNCSNLIYRR